LITYTRACAGGEPPPFLAQFLAQWISLVDFAENYFVRGLHKELEGARKSSWLW
jgi:hypothetical protein